MSYNTLNAVKRAVVLCLLAAALAVAQRQSVVVLPTIADSDVKLSPRELDHLTEKVRSIVPNILPLKDFNLLKQDAVLERLGAEGLFAACKEGSCVGDLVARVQADFGARCEVTSINKQLYLKFELYGTLRGERDAGTIDLFNDPVKDFNAMLALLDKKVPVAFKKIVAETAPAQTPAAPAVGGNVVAQITTEPAGAALNINGIPYPGCSKTPCTISLYENRFKLSASLNEYETADTNIVITIPNQLVNIKLKPIMYQVYFLSQPSGASLSFDGKSYSGCRQTPCGIRFVKGDVKVTANLNMHETKDTTIFVSQNKQRIDLKLLRNYETLTEKTSDLEDAVDVELGYKAPERIDPQVNTEEYQPSNKSFWVAFAFDIIGIAAIGYGISKDMEVNDSYGDYKGLGKSSGQREIDNAWQKADDARTARNVSYILGGVFLATGIGVHIWF